MKTQAQELTVMGHFCFLAFTVNRKKSLLGKTHRNRVSNRQERLLNNIESL